MKNGILKTLALGACLVMSSPLCAFGAEKLSVMLDWFPNVDHLPIYVAQEEGYFKEAGLEVEIITPSETSDSLKLAMAGKVDIAVGYQPQTIMAAAEGLNLKAVGRLVGHPLTTLLFLEDRGFKSPKDLEGKKIGYTVPGMMDLIMEAFAKENGIDKYEAINVGFTIVPSLVSGQVDAVMGPFKTYEVVTMAHEGLKAGYFELEKHGIPPYDELIFLTSPQIWESKKEAVTAFCDAVQRAIDRSRADRKGALALYLNALPEADKDVERDAFFATLPYFADSQEGDLKRWQDFAAFALSSGLIDTEVDPSAILAR
ncbi:ABC transporter substrate-binding protein [Dethiosulfovibrio salsuginis]|uniref:Putative hydroxymethylpyrimidine transport system substrate-binding protein n=1 Tax=Dethiosulfovibrio salsuginis TaxID=561720 RepID=A0A1X7K3B3_9BACT|nr:ABC transporter substrate-binding protein [Dethiosulfovibrio salsuginis]SMG35193.1 putative hydroxymethylpyrimidine transport system substrate-binding protein [Dethiosulfovibrio salsuginis]